MFLPEKNVMWYNQDCTVQVRCNFMSFRAVHILLFTYSWNSMPTLLDVWQLSTVAAQSYRSIVFFFPQKVSKIVQCSLRECRAEHTRPRIFELITMTSRHCFHPRLYPSRRTQAFADVIWISECSRICFSNTNIYGFTSWLKCECQDFG